MVCSMRKVILSLLFISVVLPFVTVCKSKKVRRPPRKPTTQAAKDDKKDEKKDSFVAAEPSKLDMRMTAGNIGGTYYQIATTLNSLPGVTISVWETNGSTENINLVGQGKAELALTQLDVMQNMVAANRSLGQKVKILIPLFTEEIHIIAPKTMSKIEDLKGKKVSIGPEGSGTRATSLAILQAYGINDKSFQADGSKSKVGLDKLQKGEVDAVIIVAGAPVPMLKELDAGFGNKYHMINFRGRTYSKLRKTTGYNMARLRKKIYKWVNRPVRTISVDSAIVAKSDLSDSNVENLIQKVFDRKNFEELFLSHEKWQELNIKNIKKRLRSEPTAFHPAALKTYNAM